MIGESDVAKIFLQKILDKDPSYTDAHILMAQVRHSLILKFFLTLFFFVKFSKIYIMLKDYKSSNQSLELGLSYNFQIKNHPTYHLIKARILKQQNQIEEALRTLQLAMQLPGVKKQYMCFLTMSYISSFYNNKIYIKAKSAIEITMQDRVAV